MSDLSVSVPALEARHVTKRYPAPGKRTLIANNDVNLTLHKGRTLAIIGESGCGKSTFLRMAMSLEQPSEGQILFMGEDVSRLKGKALHEHRRHIQMVFQDPAAAFDPRMKVADIICEPLGNFGLVSRQDKMEIAASLLEMVGLPADFVSRFPHSMSGGQRQRIGIARALALEPEVIMCDEPTSALDVTMQKMIIELLVELQKEKGVSIGFVCHDLALAQSFAHQVAVMYLGSVVEVIPGEDIAEKSMHPYTRVLTSSVFDLSTDPNYRIDPPKGEVPSPLDVPAGCPFANRCERRTEECSKDRPSLEKVGKDHMVACFNRVDS